MRKKSITAAILAGALLGLAGCAGQIMPGTASTTNVVTATSSSPAAGPDLDGRTFLSTAVAGHHLVDDTRVSLTFADGVLSGYAGCNTLSGSYLATGDRLQASNVGMTEIGCPSALAEQDTWLADFLSAGPTWHLSGADLTLHSGSVTIELTDKKVADPDLPLVGTTWELTGLIEDDAASSIPVGSTPVHLELDDDSLRLWNDCVAVSGAYTLTGDTLTASLAMPPVTSSCHAAEIATAVAVLQQSAKVTVDADQLQVVAPDGRGLTLRAIGAGTNPPTSTDPPRSPDRPTSTQPPTSTHTAPVSPSTTASVHSTSGPPSTIGTARPAANPLAGRTFVLTRLFTDDGGVNTKYPDARFRITFGERDADAVSQCGQHHYDRVVVGGQQQGMGTPVDLGTPTGPDCSLGTDPSGLPSGKLYFGTVDGSEFYLTGGMVAWYFDEVIA